ncbi:MAG: ABC transporter permease [Pygmaiobacter massiliensis]|nr:ABC transporter permease [Pygmaiobacter massiliensis]
MSSALYRKEMKGSAKLLVIFAAVLSLYICMIISMYDPKMAQALEQFEQMMPNLMAAVGMTGDNTTLAGFMGSYLYGMILLVFPMVYSILRANGLVAKYVESGSMAVLLAAPVKRAAVVRTQLVVLLSGIFLLLGYCTVLEWAAAQLMFPGELALGALLRLNVGLLCLQIFIGAVCFFFSCLFNETRLSLAFGAGIPVFMYLLQMLANMGGKLEWMKYLTFFTLFWPEGLADGLQKAWLGTLALLCAGIALAFAGITVFKQKDLPL